MRVAGRDVVDDPDGVRASIGVTGQFSAVDELLTGKENLQLMADLNDLGRTAGRARVSELLDRFGLVDAATRPVSTYSGGHAPPSRPGHDADRLAAGDLPRRADDRARPAQPPPDVDDIRHLAADGVTIFLTTQYLDEADEAVDRIAVLDRGRVVAVGTPTS